MTKIQCLGISCADGILWVVDAGTDEAYTCQSTIVSATVYFDIDGNNMQDEGEMGIEGYTMIAID